MSMLAEPRSRQKWSEDPRNTRWANDKTKFGYQMMTKMGWSEGQGLGTDLTGSTKHIGVRKKKGQHGVGAAVATDDNWIAHQDDFNALLGALNQGLPCPVEPKKDALSLKIASLESTVKRSSKKIMYQKYVRGKDLSRASANDLASIFGQRGQVSNSAPNTPQLSGDEGHDSDASNYSEPDSQGMHITTASLDMNEYFAEKMAAYKLRREARLRAEQNAGSLPVTDECANERAKRAVVELVGDEEKENAPSRNSDEVHDRISAATDEEAAPIGKKKKKKKKKTKDAIMEPTIAVDDTDKHLHHGGTETTVTSQETETELKVERKKKKKKRAPAEACVVADCAPETVYDACCRDDQPPWSADDACCSAPETADATVVKPESKKKKKKKKKKRSVEEQPDASAVTASEDNGSTVTADVTEETTDLGVKRKKKKGRKNKELGNVVESIGDTDAIVNIGGSAEEKRTNKRKLDDVNHDAVESKPSTIIEVQSSPPKKKKKKKRRDHEEI